MVGEPASSFFLGCNGLDGVCGLMTIGKFEGFCIAKIVLEGLSSVVLCLRYF